MSYSKEYVDERGWKYKVMSGIGPNAFKARYQKPDQDGADGWKSVTTLPWRSTFDEAQADLDRIAQQRGWAERDVTERS